MNHQEARACLYLGTGGKGCVEPVREGKELCFWHDPSASKDGPDIKERLEKMASEGASMEGFILKEAKLRDAHLTFGDTSHAVNLSHADLSRADLGGAHLFNIDLRDASLLKANLRQANLNRARLEDANLLGADLEGARLEQVNWGRHLSQEVLAQKATRAGQAERAMDLYLEAEEIYRHLTNIVEAKGHYNQAGHFYHKEKIMRRMQMRRWTREWMWSKIVDVLCGYGENFDRVIGFSLSAILVSAVLFALLGIQGPEGMVRLNLHVGMAENMKSFLLCVYYSVVTFTTLGYGDFTPVGWSRLVAASEAFTGAFAMALFVVVFVRHMTR